MEMVAFLHIVWDVRLNGPLRREFAKVILSEWRGTGSITAKTGHLGAKRFAPHL